MRRRLSIPRLFIYLIFHKQTLRLTNNDTHYVLRWLINNNRKFYNFSILRFPRNNYRKLEKYMYVSDRAYFLFSFSSIIPWKTQNRKILKFTLFINYSLKNIMGTFICQLGRLFINY